jgi:hypothetical protein
VPTERWRGESPIFVKTYDLLLWLAGRVSQFPKQHRFRLAKRIEDAAFDFHERLLQAARSSSSRTTMRLLLEADVELDKLRYYVRMAADPQLKLLTSRQYEHASRLIAEVGKLLGGWIKKVKEGKEKCASDSSQGRGGPGKYRIGPPPVVGVPGNRPRRRLGRATRWITEALISDFSDRKCRQ